MIDTLIKKTPGAVLEQLRYIVKGDTPRRKARKWHVGGANDPKARIVGCANCMFVFEGFHSLTW